LENKTDEELMVLYQNGAEQAFQILYARHAGKIFGFIKNKVKKEEQARDIFQEVFTKIHKSKHLYNKTLPALPWIFTITRTTLIDSLRKDKISKNVIEMDLERIAVSEPETSSTEELTPHLSKLPANQRTAIELRYFEEKTFEEIAEKLNTSELNVRQIISRGLKRVRELIGEKRP
jgi:RNA polymerase sigma factor (sigma-70 family)